MPFGDRLRDLRMRKGQSLQQVAYAISASKAHVWELESNRSKNPSLDLLQKLASHYNTTVSYLVEEGDTTASAEFVRRNSDKLAALSEEELDVIERLIEVLAQRSGDPERRGTGQRADQT
jgi:transcriptional regulator with XRE-family HTH domain